MAYIGLPLFCVVIAYISMRVTPHFQNQDQSQENVNPLL